MSVLVPSENIFRRAACSGFRVKLSEVVSARDKAKLSHNFPDGKVDRARLNKVKAIRLIETNADFGAVMPLQSLDFFPIEVREEAYRIEVDSCLL